jgi:hypothetical protein
MEIHEHAQRMKQSELRRRTGLRLHELIPLREVLEKQGRIRIEKDIISTRSM